MPIDDVVRVFSRQAFGEHLPERVGDRLAIPGFPLGFFDTVHHLPVVRQASVASCHGVRFQGQGYFLTDARTHRGTSGAPVVMRVPSGDAQLHWKLLGVHSARMEMGGRDLQLDDSLGLNCVWYADILLTLTADAARAGRSPLLALSSHGAGAPPTETLHR